MDIERLKVLRDKIDTVDPKLFDMGRYSKKTACGTAYCIGGWASVMFSTDYTPELQRIHAGAAYTIGMRELNLQEDEAQWLFLGYFSENDITNISKEEAITALNSLIAGYEIPDWFAAEDREKSGRHHREYLRDHYGAWLLEQKHSRNAEGWMTILA